MPVESEAQRPMRSRSITVVAAGGLSAGDRMLVVTADAAEEEAEERVGLPPDMVAVQLVFARRDVEAAASVEAYVDRKLANLRAAVLAEFRAQGWR